MKDTSTPKPTRPLSTNFTDSTLKRAIKAKRRIGLRELLTMKKVKLLQQPVGALIVALFVVLGGAGVYAATNWFGGVVKVMSDDSIMSVDLTECDSSMPPGVEPDTDRSNIKFKITGSPHISAEDLQRKLLTHCEFYSVSKFYQEKYGDAIVTQPAAVKDIDSAAGTASFDLAWGGQDYVKTFKLAADFVVTDKGEWGSLDSLKTGDFVMLAYKLPDASVIQENVNQLDGVKEVLGVFKTQYDTREFIKDGKTLYGGNNIMPLDWYNQIHKK